VAAGWLGDILSYSRLLALGLATGVIASVFNSLGAMAGMGVLGAVVFILVFLIGQTMNMGINLLGAYVHSNRLEYVEFFSKFYEATGVSSAPLAFIRSITRLRRRLEMDVGIFFAVTGMALAALLPGFRFGGGRQ
jgi:vacuolar-type H+-ATPase subunit I/STV1